MRMMHTIRILSINIKLLCSISNSFLGSATNASPSGVLINCGIFQATCFAVTNSFSSPNSLRLSPTANPMACVTYITGMVVFILR